jgi:hypothetical protein
MPASARRRKTPSCIRPLGRASLRFGEVLSIVIRGSFVDGPGTGLP